MELTHASKMSIVNQPIYIDMPKQLLRDGKPVPLPEVIAMGKQVQTGEITSQQAMQLLGVDGVAGGNAECMNDSSDERQSPENEQT